MRKYILINDRDRICPKSFYHKIHSIFSEKKKIMHSHIPKSKAVHAK